MSDTLSLIIERIHLGGDYAKRFGQRSDLWALGCHFSNILTLRMKLLPEGYRKYFHVIIASKEK